MVFCSQGRFFTPGRIRIAIGILAGLLLAGCGGGGGDSNGGGAAPAAQVCPTPSANANTLNERVYAYLQDTYLWCDQVPVLAPNTFATVDALVDRVRYRPTEYDRFSYVDTVANYIAFFEEGKSTGYGLGLSRLANNAIAITYTEPGSPATLGGLQRGLTLLAVNGFTTAQLDAGFGGGYQQQLGVTTAGVPARFTVVDGAIQRDISINSATYSLTSVWRSELLTPTLGYLQVKQFIATTKAEIRSTFAQAGWNAVTDLIVDLRYNGGGRVTEASRLASHILGAPHAGKVFASLQYNVRQAPGNNFTFTFGDTEGGVSFLRATAIRRVAVIVSQRTCSASEEALASLRAILPSANFFVVGGSATCGKPFGFLPQAFQMRPGIDDPNDPVVNAINFRSIAADGTTDYIKGFPPRCVIADDLTRALTDPNEALRRTAQTAVETGACPPGTAAVARAQPLVEREATLPDPLPAGLKRDHTTW
ncbi:MAG: S41 family peptidase [Burkholderiales bacterium]